MICIPIFGDYRVLVLGMDGRIMLDKGQKRVTWKQDVGRVNANDSKARVRHLETVKARILARRARTTKQLGRE